MRKLTVALTLITALSASMILRAEPTAVQQDKELRQVVDGAQTEGAPRGVRGYTVNQNGPSVATGKTSTARTNSNTAVPQPNQGQKNPSSLATNFRNGGKGFAYGGLIALAIGVFTNDALWAGAGVAGYGLGFALLGASLLTQNKRSIGGKGMLGFGAGMGLMASNILGAPYVFGLVGLGLAIVGAVLSLFP